MNNNKPIILEINDFRQKVVELINSSSIPMCIINMMLKEIILQCNEIEKQQYEIAMKQYTESQKLDIAKKENDDDK